MNRKGFTLVELLGVIVILSLLALITTIAVTKLVVDAKNDLSSTQIELIKKAAKIWGAENIKKLPDVNKCSYITLEDLKGYGLLDSNISDPKYNKSIPDELEIKITTELSDSGNSVTTYEVNPKNIEGCSHAMPCILVSGEENAIGSKYVCRVKPGTKYNFYVLSYEDDGTTNLIMDRNMCSDGTPVNADKSDDCYVAWNSNGSNTSGPATAINYLYNATKTWINIPPLNYTYYDKLYHNIPDHIDRGYSSFISTNGIATISGTTIGTENTPLRARLPIYSAKWNTSGTEKTEEKGEVSDKKIDKSNDFLYENLDSSGKNAPYGYWTLSSFYKIYTAAWRVYNNGQVLNASVSADDAYGIRPVINIKL